jgi:Domain of unknown function (DUF4105)
MHVPITTGGRVLRSRRMRRLSLALLLICDIGVASVSRGAEPAPAAPVVAAPAVVDDPLKIFVVTFGPGDHPFFKFGHDALLVRDRAAGTDKVYNFGTFRFEPGLVGEFLKGRLTYWLSVSSLPAVVASYERENRTIAVQELALTPAAKRELQARLDDNARPDKREYKYDYFLDNCATRVRDAVDRATGGALRASARVPGRLTLRDQALRMTADVPWLYLALDLVLAGVTDRPIDRWGEMYIPEELERGLRAVTVPGPAGPRPLVASEGMMAQAIGRPPPLEAPPSRGVTLLLVGLGIGLVFVALGWAAPNRPAVRALFGVVVAVWSLVVGFIGSFLLYAWMFTDHVVAHRNENILQCAPWGLVLGALGFGVAFGSRRATLAALRLAVAAMLLALAGWGLKAHPAFHQHNAALIALLLPPWVGMSIGLLHARHGS